MALIALVVFSLSVRLLVLLQLGVVLIAAPVVHSGAVISTVRHAPHLLSPVLIPIVPPTPDDAAANSMPIKLDGLFGALMSIGIKLASGIGAAAFVFMFANALKERPIKWGPLIGDGAGIVALIALAVKSTDVLVWIAARM